MAKYTIGGIGSRVVLEDGQYFGAMDTEEDTVLVVRLLNEHADKLPWPRRIVRAGTMLHLSGYGCVVEAGWPVIDITSPADLRTVLTINAWRTCNRCKPERP